MAAGRHAWLLGHARAVSLVALHVILVGHRLLGLEWHVGHVVAGHVRVLGHARSAGGRGDVGARLLRRLATLCVDAVFAAGCRLGGVETGLKKHVSIVFWMIPTVGIV